MRDPTKPRVLVTWGSKRGGTAGLAQIVAESLRDAGFEVTAAPAQKVRGLEGYGAVIVGGALYANRWHSAARRFVLKNVAALRRVPVWLFSSGPLDDSADQREIPAPDKIAVLAERVGALGHTTFGGFLAPDAKGFPASAMAKKHAGDWRNPERVRAWATQLARGLPDAKPGVAHEPPGRSMVRLLTYAAMGWALCAATMAVLLQLASHSVTFAVHAVAAPVFFTLVAREYFKARGSREPLFTALVFTATVAVLDASLVSLLILHSFAMFASVWGTGLPLALIFLATWATGAMMSTMPWPKPGERPAPPRPSRPAHA